MIRRLRLWLWAGLAAAGAVAWAYLQGRQDEASRARTEDLEAYQDTREAIDDAEIHGDDPAAAREWLQLYADRERRRDL